ncbi:MAG: GUN4 domain-containing protein [Microcoleaceae cyanobacterium]
MIDSSNPENLNDSVQVGQLLERIEQLENQLNQVLSLSERIDAVESDISLVPDVQRYDKLRKCLAEKRWFDADTETIQLIITIAGETELEELTPEEIASFPCGALRVIDNLWSKYSQEKFGFSTQLKIYKEVGGDLETTLEQNQAIVEQWGEKVGWRDDKRWLKCDQLDYSLNAPIGCHPSRWWNSPFGSKMTNYFLARLIRCGF